VAKAAVTDRFGAPRAEKAGRSHAGRDGPRGRGEASRREIGDFRGGAGRAGGAGRSPHPSLLAGLASDGVAWMGWGSEDGSRRLPFSLGLSFVATPKDEPNSLLIKKQKVVSRLFSSA